ncbi:uncharacterized protein [Triticum aestivum]|uniref:uncharacterized protein n=1 Tax=Triticum aestivum TaxID=4565 RepID=UPI0001BA8E75|nr:uncharacterized protein LOC123146210 [Triticum aestivum]
MTRPRSPRSGPAPAGSRARRPPRRGDKEARERRRDKGRAVRRPRPELAGAGRWRTGAGDGGIPCGGAKSLLFPTTTAAWPREDSARRRAGAAQEQPWMLRIQGVQARFGVVPSQAPAIPHLSRRSASRLFSSVAGPQEGFQGGLGSGCAPQPSQPSRGAPEITT